MNGAIGNIWASMLSLIPPDVLLVLIIVSLTIFVSSINKSHHRNPAHQNHSKKWRAGEAMVVTTCDRWWPDPSVPAFYLEYQPTSKPGSLKIHPTELWHISAAPYEEMLNIGSGRSCKTDHDPGHDHHVTRSKCDTTWLDYVRPARMRTSRSERFRTEDEVEEVKHTTASSENEFTGSCRLKFLDGLLSSCGGEKIIVLTTTHRDLYDAALLPPFNMDIHIHTFSPQPIALPDGREIVELKQKPLPAIYDQGFQATDNISWKSLETLLPREQPNDCVPFLSLGRLRLEGCVQHEKSPDLPRVMQINGVESRVTKSPRYFGGLTAQSISSSHVVLNPLEQSTKNVAHVARLDQCSPSVPLPEKKMVRRTLKRKCRTMSIIFEIHQQRSVKRYEGTAKRFRAKRICRKHGIYRVSTVERIHKQHGIHRWSFRQKWATRGYSLGEKRPYEVSSLSMDERLVSRFLFIHMSQFPRSSLWPLALPNGSKIVGPIALSLNEFAATKNRAHLVRQNQSGSTASHYERKNTRETSGRQGITESLSSIEDLQQHFGCKHKDAVKVCTGKYGDVPNIPDFPQNKGPEIFRGKVLHTLDYCKLDDEGTTELLKGKKVAVIGYKKSAIDLALECAEANQEQQAFVATDNIAHLVKADQGIRTVSYSEMENKRETLKKGCSVLSLEDLRQHYGGRHEDAMKGLGGNRPNERIKWTRDGRACWKPVGPKKGEQTSLEKHFKGVCIDTGFLLYRYRSAHTETEATGIDTGLLLYRYRVH